MHVLTGKNYALPESGSQQLKPLQQEIFLNLVHSMQDWSATTVYGVTWKRGQEA